MKLTVDPAGRDRLIEDHLPLVRCIARRLATGAGELDDLVQAGAIGLVEAADRFEASRGSSFAAYAVPTIVGEIRRHLRDRSTVVRVPRRVQSERAALRRAERELIPSLGRIPSRRELAERAGVSLQEAELALASDHVRRPLPLPWSEPVGLPEPATFDDWPCADDRIAVRMALRCLDQRDRALIERRFFDDLSQDEIAREIGVSQVQVSRLLRSALDRMRKNLDDRPVAGANGRP